MCLYYKISDKKKSVANMFLLTFQIPWQRCLWCQSVRRREVGNDSVCQRRKYSPFPWMWIIWELTWRRLWLWSQVALIQYSSHPDLSEGPCAGSDQAQPDPRRALLGPVQPRPQMPKVTPCLFILSTIYSSKNAITSSDVCG